jgi:hypothetical protein
MNFRILPRRCDETAALDRARFLDGGIDVRSRPVETTRRYKGVSWIDAELSLNSNSVPLYSRKQTSQFKGWTSVHGLLRRSKPYTR